jgi:hypothetical protein
MKFFMGNFIQVNYNSLVGSSLPQGRVERILAELHHPRPDAKFVQGNPRSNRQQRSNRSGEMGAIEAEIHPPSYSASPCAMSGRKAPAHSQQRHFGEFQTLSNAEVAAPEDGRAPGLFATIPPARCFNPS